LSYSGHRQSSLRWKLTLATSCEDDRERSRTSCRRPPSPSRSPTGTAE
jgi:hypothetical protein